MLVVLNGGSSSGKTTIAKALQALLPGTWLRFSVDDLVDALPADAIGFGDDGSVTPGESFAEAERAWRRGLAAMGGVVLDDVLLDGGASQARARAAFGAAEVLWVGVRCDPEVAARREAARGDRPPGMAARQARSVHEGVVYDVEVDTTRTTPDECARVIAARVG